MFKLMQRENLSTCLSRRLWFHRAGRPLEAHSGRRMWKEGKKAFSKPEWLFSAIQSLLGRLKKNDAYLLFMKRHTFQRLAVTYHMQNIYPAALGTHSVSEDIGHVESDTRFRLLIFRGYAWWEVSTGASEKLPLLNIYSFTNLLKLFFWTVWKINEETSVITERLRSHKPNELFAKF